MGPPARRFDHVGESPCSGRRAWPRIRRPRPRSPAIGHGHWLTRYHSRGALYFGVDTRRAMLARVDCTVLRIEPSAAGPVPQLVRIADGPDVLYSTAVEVEGEHRCGDA